MAHPRTIAIVGPTAVGKSDVADTLAAALGAEVISADSMQVYRHMDIGTAKTPPDARSVRYHCIDLVDPGVPYSAALYQRDARTAIEDLHRSGRAAVLVGGTGLYLRAALDDMEFPAGEIGGALRAQLEHKAAADGPQALYEELRRLDAASAELIHPNNTRRVIRALEMLSEGASYADRSAGFSRRTFHYPDTVLVGLALERGELYRRVDARVDRMLDQGLLDEVALLLGMGFGDALTASQAIGYKELVPVVCRGASLDAAVDEIKRSTRRYAKRQLTWFRADPRIVWLDVDAETTADTARRVLDLVESTEHHA